MKIDNELIAEFMGELGLTKVQDNKIVPYVPSYTIWQTLMPVVEKIHSLQDEIMKIGIGIDAVRNFFTLYITAPIEKVYKAVVEFIKWFNETLALKTK